MKFVAHVPDALVTDLVYHHMPSWHAVWCYFDWRAQYAAQQRLADGIGRRRRDGAVLTEAGWLVPLGELNPRIIDQPGSAVMSPVDVAEQQRIDEGVDLARLEHEHAVLYEDMAIFALQWRAVVERDVRSRWQLREAQGDSQQREAFMVRWNAANRPH